jgi:hypothetical protein
MPMNTKVARGALAPEKVAAIMAALSAAGLLSPGDRVTGITKKGKQNPWKRSGLIKIMQDRDFSLHE